MGTVFNIQKFCLHDGDGIRTCVFLKGCPLNCVWCHNPEGLDIMRTLSFDVHKCTSCGRCAELCSARKMVNGSLEIDRKNCLLCGKCAEVCLNGTNEIIGKEVSAEEVVEEVMKDKIFYETSGGGITVTGGEPSYQAYFTLELLRLCQKEGIGLAVETCGNGSRQFYKEATDFGTVFLYDVKCIDPVLHRKLTGADNSRIMSNLQYLMDIGADVIIRLPMIPECNDSDEDIAELADFLNKNKGRYRYAEIMPYHSLGTGKSEKTGKEVLYNHKSADEADIARWCSLFASHGLDLKVSE